ncbi:MAG: glycosyltransferase family 39 protein [Chloroflexota bacterium]
MIENANPVRWLAFTGIAVLAALLLMLLPYPLSTLVLLVMLLISVQLAVRYTDNTWGGLLHNLWARIGIVLPTYNAAASVPQPLARPEMRRMLVAGFGMLALVFMVGSALNFRAEMPDEVVNTAFVWMFAGAIALGLALWLARGYADSLLPLPTLAEKTASQTRMNWILTGVSLLLLAALVEINTGWLQIGFLASVSQHIQFAMFVIALVVLGAGFCGFRVSKIPQEWRTLRGALAKFDARSNALTIILVLAITTLAAILRFWQLGQTARFEVDELQAVTAVNRLLSNPNVRILTVIKPLHWNWAWLFPYVETQFVNLIGHNWAGLRVIGALFGTLTIPLQYALARAWFDRKTALMATLLLAVFPAFVHFSRFSLINIADPLLAVLIFGCLSWAVRTNRRVYFVLGGIFLGLSQYFYEGGRLLYPPLAIAWFVALAVFWRRDFNRRYALMSLLIALLVALPFYLTLEAQGRPFGERLNDNFIGWAFFTTPGEPVIRHIIQPFLAFVHDPDWRFAYLYYGGSQPLLLWYMVIPFLLGFVYMIWRILKPGMLLLALWIVLAVLGSALVRDNGMVARYLGLFPVLTILVAVGIRYLLPLIWPREGRLPVLAMGLLVGVFSIAQVNYYFGTHLPQYEVYFRQLRPGRDLDDVVLRASQLPSGTQVHIITDWPEVDNYYKDQVSWTSEYFIGKKSHISLDILGQDDFTEDYLSQLSHMANQAFFVVPDDAAVLDRISHRFHYSTGEPSPYADIPADEQYILYYVPSSP